VMFLFCLDLILIRRSDVPLLTGPNPDQGVVMFLSF
jgi:hypothetical protein